MEALASQTNEVRTRINLQLITQRFDAKYIFFAINRSFVLWFKGIERDHVYSIHHQL